VKKKSILVGLKHQQILKIPKFDSNNLVLVDNNSTSLGTIIQMPYIFWTKMKEQTHSKEADYTELITITDSCSVFILPTIIIYVLNILL